MTELICISILNALLMIIVPLYLSICWVVVKPNQAVITQSFGKVRKVIMTPGCHYNPLLEPKYVSTKIETL